jgi:transaldolase
LLFSVARYEEVIDAYMTGLERRVAAGEPVETIASVASFFVSRVDTKVDPLLPSGSGLRGRVAIANASWAYARYLDRFCTDRGFADDRWLSLQDAGAHPQRPLWASTGTKDPAYSDVLYVEGLIAPDVVNTMPEATLRVFADHGEVGPAVSIAGRANAVLRHAQAAGIDLGAITSELERVSSFCDSYRRLLDQIRAKLEPTLPLKPCRGRAAGGLVTRLSEQHRAEPPRPAARRGRCVATARQSSRDDP